FLIVVSSSIVGGVPAPRNAKRPGGVHLPGLSVATVVRARSGDEHGATASAGSLPGTRTTTAGREPHHHGREDTHRRAPVSSTVPRRASGSEVVPQRGDPFASRSLPLHAAEVHLATTIEADALVCQELALCARRESIPVAAAACRIDDPMPGHQVQQ